MTATITRDALLRDCVRDMKSFFHALSRADSQHWLGLEITMGQLKAMLALGVGGPLSVGELGRRLGISEPAASLLVDRLEEQGLATRGPDETDRRRTLVSLTDAAEQLGERLRHTHGELLDEYLDRLSDDELEALGRGLAALVRLGDDGRPAPEAGGVR